MATSVRTLFRDPVQMTFTTDAGVELVQVTNPTHVPRVGENVRILGVPYLVERVGYDYPDEDLAAIWIRCREARSAM